MPTCTYKAIAAQTQAPPQAAAAPHLWVTLAWEGPPHHLQAQTQHTHPTCRTGSKKTAGAKLPTYSQQMTGSSPC
jgi:hypothetical protein